MSGNVIAMALSPGHGCLSTAHLGSPLFVTSDSTLDCTECFPVATKIEDYHYRVSEEVHVSAL